MAPETIAFSPGCDKGVGSAPTDGAPAPGRVSKGIAPQIGYTAPDFELISSPLIVGT